MLRIEPGNLEIPGSRSRASRKWRRMRIRLWRQGLVAEARNPMAVRHQPVYKPALRCPR